MRNRVKIAITLVSASFFILAFGTIFPKNPQKYLRDRFYLQKAIAKPKYDIIVMGDSRVVNGISTEVFDSVLPGFRSLNFGFSNGGLNSQMFEIAESKLNKSNKTKVMVLAVTALTLHEISLDNEHYLSLIKTPREKQIELLYFAGISNYFAPVSPIILRNLVTVHHEKWDDMVQLYHKNGWAETFTPSPDTSYAIPFYRKDYKKSLVDYAQLDVIATQIKKWTEQGIKVICFRPPTTIEMKELEDQEGNYKESLIAEKVQEAGAIWVPLDFSEYQSYDGSHLFGMSAKKLSEKLANEIKSEL